MTRRLRVAVRGGRGYVDVALDAPGGEAAIPDAPVVWLQHGFSRRPRHLAGLAAALAGRGMRVLRPAIASLAPRRSLHDPVFLTAVALSIASALAGPTARPARLVVVGHSAGCAVVGHAVSVLAERPGPPRVAGAVLLDPVDTVGGLLARALDPWPGAPVAVAALAPSRCNRHGAGTRLVSAALPATPVATWPTLSHGDPERIPGDLAATSVPAEGRGVRLACGPGGSPERVADLGEWTVATARRLAFAEAGP